MSGYTIRPTTQADREWIAPLLAERWGDVVMVTRGQAHQLDQAPGFAAIRDNQPVGLVTYHIAGDQCEVTSLDSLIEGQGIGEALLAAVVEAARAAGCARVWLITTNDNLTAIRFYQRRGFRIAAVHHGAVDAARRLKPSIAQVGVGGVEIHDEVELEIALTL